MGLIHPYLYLMKTFISAVSGLATPQVRLRQSLTLYTSMPGRLIVNGLCAGAPLERIGTCTTANYTSTSLILDLSSKDITAIPANAFTNCGAKE